MLTGAGARTECTVSASNLGLATEVGQAGGGGSREATLDDARVHGDGVTDVQHVVYTVYSQKVGLGASQRDRQITSGPTTDYKGLQYTYTSTSDCISHHCTKDIPYIRRWRPPPAVPRQGECQT